MKLKSLGDREIFKTLKYLRIDYFILHTHTHIHNEILNKYKQEIHYFNPPQN